MARIYPYGSEITDGGDVWQAFQNYDRDYYPQEVYDYIYDCLDDQSTDDVVELDVIAWCCDISQETFDADKVLQETHDEYWENALADFEEGEMPHRPLPYAVWVRENGDDVLAEARDDWRDDIEQRHTLICVDGDTAYYL